MISRLIIRRAPRIATVIPLSGEKDVFEDIQLKNHVDEVRRRLKLPVFDRRTFFDMAEKHLDEHAPARRLFAKGDSRGNCVVRPRSSPLSYLPGARPSRPIAWSKIPGHKAAEAAWAAQIIRYFRDLPEGYNFDVAFNLFSSQLREWESGALRRNVTGLNPTYMMRIIATHIYTIANNPDGAAGKGGSATSAASGTKVIPVADLQKMDMHRLVEAVRAHDGGAKGVFEREGDAHAAMLKFALLTQAPS